MPTQTKTFSVTIRAPQEEVFAYVSDLTRHPEWSGGLLRVEARTAGQVGVGSAPEDLGELLATFGPSTHVLGMLGDRYGRGHPLFFGLAVFALGSVVCAEARAAPVLVLGRLFLFRLMIDPLVGNPMMRKSMARLKEKLEGKTSE